MFRKGLKILAILSPVLALNTPAVLAACTAKPTTGPALYLLKDISDECFCNGVCGLCDLIQVGITGTNMILAFSAIIALVLFVYGGTWFWLLSFGDQNKIKQGKSLMINTVIALVIIFAAFTIVNFLFTSLVGQSFGTTCV
ncbi:MAG: hypothetical protein WCT16_02755 [Candidatus Buchananbacteria bacterium]